MGKGILGDDAPPEYSGGGGGGIWHVRLREDAEYCRLRFLNDHDEWFWERFHRTFRVDDQGRKKFGGFKICVNSFLGQACDLCNGGSQANTQVLVWCFEIEHFHTSAPSNAKTEQVEVGSRTYWKQVVNEPRIMRLPTAHLGTIKIKAERLGSLLGHEFEWIRSGVRDTKRPSYTLEVMKEAEMPKEIKEIAAALPSLEDVATGKAESTGIGGDKDGDSEGGEKKEYATREVPVEEEEEESEGETATTPEGESEGGNASYEAPF